jgi:hypothetical protein
VEQLRPTGLRMRGRQSSASAIEPCAAWAPGVKRSAESKELSMVDARRMKDAPPPIAWVEAGGWAWLERVRAAIRLRCGRYAHKWLRIEVLAVWGLAQALPHDVFDRAPLLKAFCDPIVSAIPSASSYVARSAFPQVAELILGIGWILAVLNLFIGVLLPEHVHKTKPRKVFGDLTDLKPEDRTFGAFFAGGLFMLFVIPTLLWAFLTIPLFDPKYLDNDMVFWSFTYRLSFGFVAQVASSLLGFLAALWFVAAGHFIGFFVSFWSR